MKNILIPVDFSDYSWPIVQYALDFTKNEVVEIRLIHVFDDPFVDHDMKPISGHNKVSEQTEELIHKMEIDAKQQMEILKAQILEKTKERKEKDFVLSTEIIRGFAADEILNAAHTWRPHLLLMGSRGHSKVKKIIFGTVTQSVIKHSRVAVLVLPLNFVYQSITNVLYATNFHDYDVYAIGKLMKLFQNADCKYHITHFNLDDDLESDEAKMLQLHDQVEKDHRAAKLHFEIVTSEKLQPAMDAFISNYAIDMVALTARRMNAWQYLFSRSNTLKLLKNLEVPLLVFHEA